MIMDELTQYILKELAVDPENISGTIIPREMLLGDSIYDKVKPRLPEFKKKFSTSYMTCLHDNAKQNQRWPMLNLVRQIFATYKYQMKPIRKSDGYTKDGVKKYKRYFMISKISNGKQEPPDNDEQSSVKVEEDASLEL